MLKIGDNVFCLTNLLVKDDVDLPAGELVSITPHQNFNYGIIRSGGVKRGPYNLSLTFLDTPDNRARYYEYQQRLRKRDDEAVKDLNETLAFMRRAED